MKKYTIIYADPPWAYKDKAHAGNRGATYKYHTMSVEDIKNLPVANISADDSIIFMWCTAPQLPVGLEVMAAWGYQYKTVAFNWIKLNKKPMLISVKEDVMRYDGKYEKTVLPDNVKLHDISNNAFIVTYSAFMGMGNYTRSNSEFCLLGIKGNPKRINACVRQIIMSPREEHSKKPDEVRDRIVQLMGDVSRIELFARQKVAGWDSWGNEIENDIELT